MCRASFGKNTVAQEGNSIKRKDSDICNYTVLCVKVWSSLLLPRVQSTCTDCCHGNPSLWTVWLRIPNKARQNVSRGTMESVETGWHPLGANVLKLIERVTVIHQTWSANISLDPPSTRLIVVWILWQWTIKAPRVMRNGNDWAPT